MYTCYVNGNVTRPYDRDDEFYIGTLASHSNISINSEAHIPAFNYHFLFVYKFCEVW